MMPGVEGESILKEAGFKLCLEKDSILKGRFPLAEAQDL